MRRAVPSSSATPATCSDQIAPLKSGSHRDAALYVVAHGALVVTLKDGSETGLQDVAKFKGHKGAAAAPGAILLVNNGLHVEIRFDKQHPIGSHDLAGVCDVVLEAALTTIIDLEDSIAAVDAEDKVAAYRNWLGLMQGTLTDTFQKAGATVTRHLNPDRTYAAVDGTVLTLPGRSVMLIRNVGHLMTDDSVLDRNGRPIPEGILDGFVTALIAMHDLARRKNSRTGSIYIVKPKMHGPDEVAFASDLFARIETTLGLRAQHPQDRHHGRGAPHHGEPQGMHPRRPIARVLHQHRLPRPHWR